MLSSEMTSMLEEFGLGSLTATDETFLEEFLNILGKYDPDSLAEYEGLISEELMNMLAAYFAALAENGETPSTELLGMMQAFAPNVMTADTMMELAEENGID